VNDTREAVIVNPGIDRDPGALRNQASSDGGPDPLGSAGYQAGRAAEATHSDGWNKSEPLIDLVQQRFAPSESLQVLEKQIDEPPR
jgi:hypothetical protein